MPIEANRSAKSLADAPARSWPYRFDPHFEGLGHALIFGKTGSGKSTLISLIAMQAGDVTGAADAE
jgi:type IV secretion system protein TrbE